MYICKVILQSPPVSSVPCYCGPAAVQIVVLDACVRFLPVVSVYCRKPDGALTLLSAVDL